MWGESGWNPDIAVGFGRPGKEFLTIVQINFAKKTVDIKIVYYGPGMSGKTTNLEMVHQEAPDANCGELTTISTDGDRTLYFDYMPLSLGTVAGMKTLFQLYTVPGQVYYNSTRKLVLQGVDGVIFVADSSASMLDKNLDSLRNLEENLNGYGRSLAEVPMVIQWNKRDLPDASPVEELEKLLNPDKVPTSEAIANTGEGVFPTLKALAAIVIKNVMSEAQGSSSSTGPSPAAAVPRTGNPTPPAGPMPREPQTVVAGSVPPPPVQSAASAPVAAEAGASGRAPGPRPAVRPQPPARAAAGRDRTTGSRTSTHQPARSQRRRTAEPAASLPRTRPNPKLRGAPAALLVAVGAGLAAGLGWLVMSLF